MDVARAFPAGHIGLTPQPASALASSRVLGMETDFVEHLEPPNVWRVDAYLGLPNVAQAAPPGYLREQSTVAHIDEAIAFESAHPPKTPAPKVFGGPNLFGDD
jgi:hypothetical protein